MFVVVFFTIVLTQFQLKLLFHFRVIHIEKDVGYTFTLCTIDCFIEVCYTCVFAMIKVRRFTEDLLKETLRPNCHSYLSESSISRM